jgi:hypothetical protein
MTNDDQNDRDAAVFGAFGALLDDPRTWDEPSSSGEDELVAAVARERSILAPTPARHRWLTTAAAVALGAAAAVAVTLAVTRDRTPAPEATVAMEGTELAPALHGDAEFTTKASGVEIEIHLPGLPRRDGGEFYQLWMHNCSGSAWVPAGTFHDMDYVVAWAGVAASDYPVLNVTEEAAEPADGVGQSSSGRVVAWGALVECTA